MNIVVASSIASPTMVWMSLAKLRMDVETSWGSRESPEGLYPGGCTRESKRVWAMAVATVVVA